MTLPLPDFTDKVVVLWLRTPSGTAWTLLGPHFERFDGDLWLLGKPVADEHLWTQEATISIPWNNVASFLVLESLEAFHSWYQWEDPKTKNSQGRKWFGKRENA